MITLFFSYIYQSHVLDNGFFHFTLLLFIHSTLAYGIIRISKIFSTCKSSLKAFINVVCCFMMIFLIKCTAYVGHIKSFVDNDNPKDGIEKANTWISTKVFNENN